MIVEFSNEVINSVFVIGLSLCIETTVLHYIVEMFSKRSS